MKRLAALALLSLFACKDDAAGPVAAKVPAAVAAYTTGIVSREAVVKVQFTDAVVEPAQIGAPLDKSPFETEPSIDGTALWADRQTLELRPKKALEAGRTYRIELPLQGLVEVTAGERAL